MWKFLAAVAVIALASAVYPTAKHEAQADEAQPRTYSLEELLLIGDQADLDEKNACKDYPHSQACKEARAFVSYLQLEYATEYEKKEKERKDQEAFATCGRTDLSAIECEELGKAAHRRPDPPGSAVSLCQRPRRMTRDGCQ